MADNGTAERSKLVRDQVVQIIALQVRANRLARGWTQKQLAERSGMKQSFISRVEAGKSLPNLDTLNRIASAFDVALSVRFERFKALATPSATEDIALHEMATHP